jgi:hypothetical protein
LNRNPVSWRLVAAILLLAVLSTALSLHGLSEVVARAEHAAAIGQSLSVESLWSALDLTDGVLALSTLGALILLVGWEWRKRGLSSLLDHPTPGQSAALLFILVAWLGHSFLFPGLLLSGDTASHISRFLEVRSGLAMGELPLWTNFQYIGSALLIFTGPLTYVVGGALDLLFRDPVLTTKVLLLGLQLATGLLYYHFLRRLGLARVPAMVGSIGWVGSFAYLHLFIYRGLIPQAFTILFLVLTFHAAEGLAREARIRARDWSAFAIAIGGMILTHQPHFPFTVLYLAVFGSIRRCGVHATEVLRPPPALKVRRSVFTRRCNVRPAITIRRQPSSTNTSKPSSIARTGI